MTLFAFSARLARPLTIRWESNLENCGRLAANTADMLSSPQGVFWVANTRWHQTSHVFHHAEPWIAACKTQLLLRGGGSRADARSLTDRLIYMSPRFTLFLLCTRGCHSARGRESEPLCVLISVMCAYRLRSRSLIHLSCASSPLPSMHPCLSDRTARIG